MNKKDLAKFEKILSKERDSIKKGITSLETSSKYVEIQKESSGYGIHMAEQGNEEEELEKNLAFLSREGDTLAEIEESLRKIKEGKYGICEECGGPIPKARLIAKPFARLCIKCRMEKEQAGIGENDYV